MSTEQTVLSVAAAIPTAQIEERLADGVPVVRAMPRTASTVHEGIAGLAAGAHAGDEHLQLAEDVLAPPGRVVRLPGRRWTPSRRCPAPARRTSRSSPAAMIEAGILRPRAGLHAARSPDDVRRTAKLLRDEKMHLDLREAVTSPGGRVRAIRVLSSRRPRGVRPRSRRRWSGRRSSRPAGNGARARHRARRGGRGLALRGPWPPRATSCITGGTSPERGPGSRPRWPDWSGTELWWGDERCVPPTTSGRTSRWRSAHPRPAARPSCSRPSHPGRARRRAGRRPLRPRARGRRARPRAERPRSRRTLRVALPDEPTLGSATAASPPSRSSSPSSTV